MITNLRENNTLIFGQHVNHCSASSNIKDMPSSEVPEVCFIGRSNVGKSSLINTICERKNIARISNTPGRTQLIHFYIVNKKLYLVDLPGYGYAKAPKSKIYDWNRLIYDYLHTRSRLQRIFLLIDARHGIKNLDHKMMFFLNKVGLNFQSILTKTDKVSSSNLDKIINNTELEMKNYPAARPEIISTSARQKIGIEKIREQLNLVVNSSNISKE